MEVGVSPEETAAIRDLFLPVAEAPAAGHQPGGIPQTESAPVTAAGPSPGIDAGSGPQRQPGSELHGATLLGNEALLGRMVGAVGHRLNNHLASVVGNAAFLGERVAGDPALRRAARDLQSSARKVGEMVAEVVACTGVGGGVQGPTDLAALLTSMRPLIQAPLPSGVVLEVQLPDVLPAVDATPLDVRQAVLRLAMVAALPDASGPGLVTLTARGEWGPDGTPEAVVLTLAWEGQGSVQTPHLGELESRGAELWCAQDGRRWCLRWPAAAAVTVPDSRSPRRVGVVGPAAPIPTVAPKVIPEVTPQVAQQPHRPTQPGPDALAGRAILVVDDDPDVRSALRRMLAAMGARVQEAEDGFAALSMLQDPALHLDLVLLDLVMPGLDGDEVLRSMRRMGHRTPVTLMTGSLGAGARVRDAFDRGVALMVKPFDLAALLAQLRELELLPAEPPSAPTLDQFP